MLFSEEHKPLKIGAICSALPFLLIEDKLLIF